VDDIAYTGAGLWDIGPAAVQYTLNDRGKAF